jgi:hypothetical protein
VFQLHHFAIPHSREVINRNFFFCKFVICDLNLYIIHAQSTSNQRIRRVLYLFNFMAHVLLVLIKLDSNVA